MLIHILPSLLIISAHNALGRPELSVFNRFQSMITEKDLELFNSGDGLWFPHDNGTIVRATLDMPQTLRSTAISMETRVFFQLYTRDVKNGYESIYVNDVETLKKSHFDPSRQTKFITHGWVNSKSSKACTLIRDAFLVRGNYNVIVVDWSKISLRPYGWAAVHVIDVAKYVARMVDFLEEQGINLNTTTMAGHSLGAHVMGLAAYYAKNTVNYVIGMDPAWPLFMFAKQGSRISKEDATHVEIIHTNAGLLGFPSAIGKADFYPNGGKKQVGCLIDIGGVCSHVRSFEFYAESIITDSGFYGKKCQDYKSFTNGNCDGNLGIMGGLKTYLPFTGDYYLDTERRSPFAKGPV